MARNFDGNDLLGSDTPAITSYPITISVWHKEAVAGFIFSLGINASQSINIWRAGSELRFYIQSSGADVLFQGTRGTAGEWVHYALSSDDTNHAGYTNGANKATNVTAVASDVWNKLRIGCDAADSSFAQGDIAEVAIYNAVLSDDEIASLGKGYSPSLIRPSALKGYWPLFGRESPEPDRSSNVNELTVTGSAQAEHPRIIRAPFIFSGDKITPVIPTYTQEGLQFYNDDGDEDASTPAATQDSQLNFETMDTPVRLRILTDTSTKRSIGERFKLQYREVGTDNWFDVGPV